MLYWYYWTILKLPFARFRFGDTSFLSWLLWFPTWFVAVELSSNGESSCCFVFGKPTLCSATGAGCCKGALYSAWNFCLCSECQKRPPAKQTITLLSSKINDMQMLYQWCCLPSTQTSSWKWVEVLISQLFWPIWFKFDWNTVGTHSGKLVQKPQRTIFQQLTSLWIHVSEL